MQRQKNVTGLQRNKPSVRKRIAALEDKVARLINAHNELAHDMTELVAIVEHLMDRLDKYEEVIPSQLLGRFVDDAISRAGHDKNLREEKEI